MKYAIVIPDGCADQPQDSLGGLTPLQAARTPGMDRVAAEGVVGRASHVPPHLPAGSDVANLSLLGYDPNDFFTGCAPLEAAAQGIELGENDWAIRCNLVTIAEQQMKDFTAGHISTAEAAELLADLESAVGWDYLQFVPGVSYRNLAIWRGDRRRPPFTRDTRTSAPHDLTDKSVMDDYPRGPGSDVLAELMSRSLEVFHDHPVNRRRIERRERPATNVWLWGLGRAARLPSFRERHGLQGAMITAVDLLRGLARLVGWQNIQVPGATGYLDTDYAAKGRYAVDALPEVDLICVHVEATDEASHEGNVEAKVEALEQIDRYIVEPLHRALEQQGEYRILISPDHPTPLHLKTHSHGAVPFAIAGSGISPMTGQSYDEPTAERSTLAFDDGWKLMDWFLRHGDH